MVLKNFNEMKIKEKILMKELAEKSKKAFYEISNLTTIKKNSILNTLKQLLIENSDGIISENKKDIEIGKEKGLNNAMLDRLILTSERIIKIADSLDEIVNLEDPVGEISNIKVRPNGLKIGQMRIPIGTILIIYEARPNVTIDAAALCLKSGNATILKGGSESINSNRILVKLIRKAFEINGCNSDCVSFVDTTDYSKIDELLKLNQYIDLVIPRGGERLIKAVVEKSNIPVIKHYKGVCHVYIDDEYDKNMALNIVYNAKVQRPGVCNSMETLLVNEAVAQQILPEIKKKLDEAKVELYGCEKTLKILPDIKKACESDWYEEYLDLKLAVKIVKNIDQAIEHINKYGSSHSESIITNNYFRSEKFLREVDSAAVFVNASTRFSDGNEFGLGAEIGISTDKLHARGPMGLKELTTQKFIIYGNGQVRK
jgi:glutamate-5-semialdehyde dehydrogenase